VLLNFFFILTSQVYRYRNVSTASERQQTKWFLLGFGVIIMFIPVSFISGNQGGFVDDIATVALYTPLPISLAFAILRYHLWDIDVIIRRTLVYGGLTATLALIYFGGVILLQGILSAITGESRSEIVTVVTTLLIAALFTPLRKRIQGDIDRRFYRRKYNAEQALASFSALARQETDLDELRRQVEHVVEQTIQPIQVSLWLVERQGQ
jgi:hypothetical protein